MLMRSILSWRFAGLKQEATVLDPVLSFLIGEGLENIFGFFEEMRGGHVPGCVPCQTEQIDLYDLQTQHWLQQFADYPLNQRQRRILAYARQHGNTFTNRAYQKVSEVDRDLAYREIQEMVRLGIVARPSGRYSRTYSIVEASASPPIPSELIAITDMLSGQGYVVNKDLRAAWGVSRFVAWKRVKKLVEEGFLRREGETNRTRYYLTDRSKVMLAQRG